MHRIIRSMIAILIVIAASLVATGSPAGAAGVLDATCTTPSSATTTFSPPLSNTPQPVTITTTVLYSPCISTAPGLTSGSRSSVVARTTQCSDLLASGSLTFTVNWNTGQTSTLHTNFTSTSVGVARVVTHTGQVNSGLFAGDNVIQTLTSPSLDLVNCTLGLGTVSSVYSTVLLKIGYPL